MVLSFLYSINNSEILNILLSYLQNKETNHRNQPLSHPALFNLKSGREELCSN